jgi:hypothetical protein
MNVCLIVMLFVAVIVVVRRCLSMLSAGCIEQECRAGRRGSYSAGC